MNRVTMYWFLLCTFFLILINTNDCSIIDYIDNSIDDATSTVNTVGSNIGSMVSESAANTADFFTSISESNVASVLTDAVYAIQQVVTLTIDDIKEAVNDFNITTWNKLVDDAKYVIYNLPQNVQTYIAIGCNYLSDLSDLEFLPFPLDVVQDDDFYTVVDCVADSVFDLAKDWTKEVATTFTSIIGENADIASIDLSPLLNVEAVEQELNDTYKCLFNLVKDIEDRKANNNDKINIFSEATDFFEFDNNLTITIEISFTVCTLSCGTAALGFAVNSKDINMAKPYYSISMGIDSSNVVGASIGASMGFIKNFTAIPGHSHAVSFGAGIDIPLLPDIDLPDLIIELSADDTNSGEFEGFSLESPIIDFTFGLNGAFSFGYSIIETKWVYTTNDLKDLWNAVENIADNKVNTVLDAYDTLTSDILGNGGFLMKTTENTMTSLYCPSGISDDNDENTAIGNKSVLQLGAIDVYEVIYGNIEDDNDCNSTSGFSAVRNICQYTSQCSIIANSETLGNVYCDENNIDLTVIYGCPDQIDVFNLGCYSINFINVIDKTWYQDYNNIILNDGWEDRNNGMAKCAKIAKDAGYHGFATYNNGMCLIANDLFDEGVYNELGRINVSGICPINGLGNDIAMNLYAFASGDVAYNDLGCINNTQIAIYNKEYNKDLESEFITFEGEHYLFQDPYKERKNKISKCAQIADEKNYKGFALYDGGKCYLSNSFKEDIIMNIRKLSNVDNSTTISCSKGTDYAYNIFTFPFVELHETSKTNGLTSAQIALIIIVPLIVIIICIVGIVLFIKYKKKNGKTINKKKSGKLYIPPAFETDQ